jgi:Flp pilus assembly protein TadG
MRRRRGNMVLEMVAVIPLFLLLIVGMVQFGKITYQYFAVKKLIYAAGRQVGVQQGVNFCDVPNDATAQAAITTALNDPTGNPIVPQLTTVSITAECADPSGALAACTSCPDINPQPGYLLVTVPEGFSFQIRLPYLNPIDISMQPYALVPFGGVS